MREPHLSHTSRCRVGVLVLVSLGKSVPMSSSPCLSRSRRAAPPAWPNSRDLAPSLRQLPHADLVSAGHRTGTSPSTTQTCGLPTLRLPLRSEEHTSELLSRPHLVCRLLLEKK